MSILPSFLSEEAVKKAAVRKNVHAVPREYGIDFKTGQMTGEVVEGREAVKVWIWLCLRTERFRYGIYSWNYGVEFEQYIGRPLSQEYIDTACKAALKEALLVNPYIIGIEDFTAVIENGYLTLSFRAVTKFGNIEVREKV